MTAIGFRNHPFSLGMNIAGYSSGAVAIGRFAGIQVSRIFPWISIISGISRICFSFAVKDVTPELEKDLIKQAQVNAHRFRGVVEVMGFGLWLLIADIVYTIFYRN